MLLDIALGIKKGIRIHDEIKEGIAQLLKIGYNRPQIVSYYKNQGVTFSLQEVSRINNLRDYFLKQDKDKKLELGWDNILHYCMDDGFVPLRKKRKVILYRARLVSAATEKEWDKFKYESNLSNAS